MKSEMRDAILPGMGSGTAVSVLDIAGGGDRVIGKRDRASSYGFEREEIIKRAKQEFFLSPGFVDPKPATVFAPTPLSMRPIAPTANPMSPFFTSRTLASLPPVSQSDSLPLTLVKVGDKGSCSSGCRQFWKAGEYEGSSESTYYVSDDIDRLRVHPKFLHSNATSHKWALGALAELLDNSMDELYNGATFVNIDVLENPKDQTKMLLVEDNGGGMDPDNMRQCMSLGYSMKSKSANTIGQYGNGFKTSTMRLGADVIVFSRCRGKDGMSSTQSIGMLSYTFLRTTGKQDIIVPIVDYGKGDDDWHQMERSTSVAWKTNMDLIVQWSPYSSEADLLQQFNLMLDQGTRIIIYNLWEDDEGQLELDFVTDAQDIQISGSNRDEKKIEMSKNFPNSRHFLTYYHSMRPFWRIWNAAGSDGRGVIGVLEANFIEPAHDKQGFERTPVLNRLEARLLLIQKTYWTSNCQRIGYAPRRYKKSKSNSEDNESTRHQNSVNLSLHSNYDARESGSSVKSYELKKNELLNSTKRPNNNDYQKSGEGILLHQPKYHFSISSSNHYGSVQSDTDGKPNMRSLDGSEEVTCSSPLSTSVLDDGLPQSQVTAGSDTKNMSLLRSSSMKRRVDCFVNGLKPQDLGVHVKLLANQNKTLKERKVIAEGKLLLDLKIATQKNKELMEKIELLEKRLKDADKEQETIFNIFLEERERSDAEEEKWRIKLKVANDAIRNLESFTTSGTKSELQ